MVTQEGVKGRFSIGIASQCANICPGVLLFFNKQHVLYDTKIVPFQ